jgi:hypothetical protein
MVLIFLTRIDCAIDLHNSLFMKGGWLTRKSMLLFIVVGQPWHTWSNHNLASYNGIKKGLLSWYIVSNVP